MASRRFHCNVEHGDYLEVDGPDEDGDVRFDLPAGHVFLNRETIGKLIERLEDLRIEMSA